MHAEHRKSEAVAQSSYNGWILWYYARSQGYEIVAVRECDKMQLSIKTEHKDPEDARTAMHEKIDNRPMN